MGRMVEVEPPGFWPSVRRGSGLMLGAVLVGFAALAVYLVRGLAVQVLIALFIAVSLDPMVRWMIKRRVKRSHAVAIVWLGVALGLTALGWFVIAPLVTQVTRLGTDVPHLVDGLRERSAIFNYLDDRFHLAPKIEQLGKDLPGTIAKNALSAGWTLLSGLLTALLIAVLAIYFMLDLPRLKRSAVQLVPQRHHATARFTISTMVDKVGSYMIGNVVISLIAGAASLVALLSMRVPFALALAVIVAVTDLIPLIGATLGAAVCVLVSAATSNRWWEPVVLLVFFVVYQQVENYFIAPRVLRNAVEVSAIGVLLSALAGVAVLGVVGALIAVPVAAAVKSLLGARPWDEDELGRPEAAHERDSDYDGDLSVDHDERRPAKPTQPALRPATSPSQADQLEPDRPTIVEPR
jgi:predicted PurR-regulated permease PerM